MFSVYFFYEVICLIAYPVQMVELREAMVEFERLVKEMDGYVGEDISLDTEALALTSLVHTDRHQPGY